MRIVRVLPRTRRGFQYAQNTDVWPHVLIENDEIITLSFQILLTIRIQTTSESGLAGSGFNSNQLDANSVWMQSIRINSHSMRIIFGWV